ncbi:hypothetical protein [Flavobacterium gelatinilyticum]|uniref:hypothetical protein n=1 Tax=Flavobacterium gelatinilyticum TaxID=3003260 RepID=UPI002480682D|nr:hypothetical protein [Flavobacterium gelatinilyticum]
MINKQIIQRLSDLHNVLYFCSEQQKYGRIYVFTSAERICINQERGSLLSQINLSNRSDEIRYYQITPALEAKVKLTLHKVDQTTWAHLIPNPFND